MIAPDAEPTRRAARQDASLVPDDDAVQSARRRTDDDVDDATVLTARRALAPRTDEIDDHTELAPRRVATPTLPDDLDATSVAGTSAPSDTHTAGGTTVEDRTEQTLLRSVRRGATAAPASTPDSSPAVAGRAAYTPGDEASDRRAPRSAGPVIANRAPVLPPSSVTPPPAPDAVASRRRRHRRRLLIAAAVAVVVLVAAVVALLLLLT